MGKGTVRAAVAAAVTAGLALCTAGCGGDEQAEQPVAPSTSSAPSESPSASPSTSDTPDPTPSAEPLSRFEDRAPVQAARRWARLYAKSINRDERRFATAESILAGHEAVVNMRQIGREDFGLFFPGPLPFTPTDVVMDGQKGRVTGCFWLNGFALEKEGGSPARKRQIGAGQIYLQKQRGRWKVLTLARHEHSCDNVPVKGIGW